MNLQTGYGTRSDCERYADQIHTLAGDLPDRTFHLMEVCGSHTMSIARHGLKALLPDKIKLLSGPGCPVCVTDEGYIDNAIRLARTEGVILTTFGDLMKVPGTQTALERVRSEGADVRVVYSPLDALEIAQEHPDRRVVFAAVGFETTAPGIAATVIQARDEGATNFLILPAHKLVPPALRALLDDPACRVDGFLCPGHVSTIIGSNAYEPVVTDYAIPSIVAGFEPTDILEAIPMLLRQIQTRQPRVETQYHRVVKPEGNRKALETMYAVYEPIDAVWRGIGPIPKSGLKVRETYAAHDAYAVFGISDAPFFKEGPCRCGDVLKGIIGPRECSIFGTACTPRTPLGPCMVSSEGSCAAEYKYGTGGEA